MPCPLECTTTGYEPDEASRPVAYDGLSGMAVMTVAIVTEPNVLNGSQVADWACLPVQYLGLVQQSAFCQINATSIHSAQSVQSYHCGRSGLLQNNFLTGLLVTHPNATS